MLAPHHLERVMEHKRNLHVHNTYAIRILITNWEDEPLDYSTRYGEGAGCAAHFRSVERPKAVRPTWPIHRLCRRMHKVIEVHVMPLRRQGICCNPGWAAQDKVTCFFIAVTTNHHRQLTQDRQVPCCLCT